VTTAAASPMTRHRAGQAAGAHGRRTGWSWWTLLVMAGLAAYLAATLDAHWVADDEGLLGQGAERVLHGELPHRDFADVYTGGLSAWHALAFRVGGVDLLTLRYAMLLVACVWLPVLFACALRFVPPVGAAILTLVAVVWSVPNYPAAMPSWYTLFLATFGFFALLRHIETGRRRWLLAAGVTGGLSILVKVTGLFFVAASALYLVASNAQPPESAQRRDERLHRPVVLLGLAGFVAALVGLLRQSLDPPHLYHFLLPGLALALGAGVAAARSGGALGGLRGLVTEAGILSAGVLLPLIVFAIPYVTTDSLSALIEGVFVAPRVRLTGGAAFAPRPPSMAAPALLLLLVLAASSVVRPQFRWVPVAAAGLTLAAAFAAGGTEVTYWIGWLAASQLTPMLVVAGCAVLMLRPPATAQARAKLYLVLAVAGLCSFVQFPFAAPIYFCFIAPLTLLAAAAVCDALGWTDRRPHAVVALLLGWFAVAWLNGRGESRLWYGLSPRIPVVPLGIPRASLRTPEPDARLYREVVDVVHRHARGDYIYAGPEAPEVYFLTGRRNPTRSLLDFTEPRLDTGSIDLALLRERGVTVLVINTHPKASRRVSDSLTAVLAAEYPGARQLGKFTVRWRE